VAKNVIYPPAPKLSYTHALTTDQLNALATGSLTLPKHSGGYNPFALRKLLLEEGCGYKTGIHLANAGQLCPVLKPFSTGFKAYRALNSFKN
jgi:hypothetical protein